MFDPARGVAATAGGCLIIFRDPEAADFLVTVVCKRVHKIASLWCKTASGEVGVSLP